MSFHRGTDAITRNRPGALTLVLVVAVALACAWLAFAYADQAIVDLDKSWTEEPVWHGAILIATWLGTWQLAPLVIALLLIAAGHHWWRLLKTIAVGYLVHVAVVDWLKLVIGRPRPRVLPDAAVFAGFGGGRSFPSGHAAFSIMMAVIISAWFPRWRWPAWVIASFVAVSRVLANAHYPSDIIVGGVIGGLAALLVLHIWAPVTGETREAIELGERRRREERERRERSPEGRAAAERARRRALLVLTVVLWIAATLLAYWFVDPVRAVHENALFQAPWMQALGRFGRHLGTWHLAPLMVAIALIVGRDRWKRLLVSILTGFVIQTALTEGIKWVFGRPRPSQIPDPDLFYGPGTDYHSFPSGHASFIFVFATICSGYFPRARVPLYVLAVFVAASRVILGAHYVSDTIFGALIGLLSGWIVLAIWRPRGEDDSAPGEQ